MAKSNGHTAEALTPGLHAELGVFVTQGGVCLTLQRCAPLLIERIVNSTQGKPDIPMIEVSRPGGRKAVERAIIPTGTLTPEQHEKLDPAVREYLRATNEWERERQIRLLTYLYSRGVAEDPPTEYLAEVQQFLPGENETTYKYLWVGSLLSGDTDRGEGALLTTAIMGLVYPTEAGLTETATSFRGEGERQPH